MTFFVVIDPIGVLPLYIGLTAAMTPAKQRIVAFRSVTIASIVLLIFAVVGQVLLEALGIKITSFKIAGGIVLFLFGVKMIFSQEIEEKAALSPEEGHDIAVFPLALPSLAGPGSMLAVTVRIANATNGLQEQLLKIGVLLLVLALTLFMFLSAQKIFRIIGQTGGSVIVRVMGIILAALAAESVLSGFQELHMLR